MLQRAFNCAVYLKVRNIFFSLYLAVRESLKADGDLDRIKAEMRTEVIKLLDCSSKESKVKTIKPSHDIVFLNELIREYLDWMGYKYSSTVFTAGANCFIYNRIVPHVLSRHEWQFVELTI